MEWNNGNSINAYKRQGADSEEKIAYTNVIELACRRRVT